MSLDTSISTDKLSRLISITIAPALVDVRIDDGFAADPRRIPAATQRPHLDQSIIVICHTGGKLSEGTAAWLPAALNKKVGANE
jgi:hypothetical protein